MSDYEHLSLNLLASIAEGVRLQLTLATSNGDHLPADFKNQLREWQAMTMASVADVRHGPLKPSLRPTDDR